MKKKNFVGFTKLPKDTYWTSKVGTAMASTATWEIWDTFVAYIPCKNRFITALRALFTGKVKWEWRVKNSIKDKRLRVTGENIESWRNK